MTRMRAVAWLGLAGVLAAGCGRRGEALTVAGSTAFQPFAQTLAKQFVALNPDVRISVQGGGSAVGIQSALSGTAQIGMADLVRLPEEAKPLTVTVAARDGIAVIVHPSNVITNLTLDQLRDVLNGQVTNWRDLGGRDGAITVVSREAGSGTRTSLEQIVGGIKLTPGAIIQNAGGTVGETVANDANAIGYLSHGMVGNKVKTIALDGQACTADALVAGRYPLVRPIFLMTRGAPQGATARFLAFILSDAGQAQIRKDGLLPAK